MTDFFMYEKQILSSMKRILNKYSLTGQDYNEGVFWIFISKTGYELFKLTLKNSQDLDYLKLNCCTSECFFKQISFDFLRNKKQIILFDDTITDGYNLLRNYAEVNKRLNEIYSNTDKPQIIPVVLTTSIEFLNSSLNLPKELNKSYKREDLLKLTANIKKDLVYEYLLSPEGIARLSLEEVKLFQKSLIPLTMNLPIYDYIQSTTDENKHHKSTSSIHLSNEEFTKLRSYNNQWEYIKNSYSVQGQE